MLTKESTLSGAQTTELDVEVPQSGVLEHLLPDASFLLYGVFSQSGFNLQIANPDGINHVVPDYFSFPTPPNLMIESGAGLSPAMVKSLFPRAFGQEVLFAGPAPSGAALVEIGSVKLVVGTVTVRHADGSQEAVKKGAVLYQGDVLVTGAGSFIKAEMRDGTKFQLGQNGEAALDQYEFDEAADVGRFEATVRVGGFYYKSGKIGELPSASAQAHTQLNTPTSIIGVRGSELEGAVDQSGETVVVHRSGVLEITDINGENAVTLDTPGNTAVVVLNGQPAFTTEPSQQAQQALQQSLPPPDGSVAEDEAVDADSEEEAEAVVEEAVAEPEETVEESTEEEAIEEVFEEVAEEVEEAELDETDDAEEEAEETSDEEDLDSLGVDESSVESQGDAENAEGGASNEGEAVEPSDDEALSTFTNPDASVESVTEDVDTTLETLQSQDSNVEGQESGELQTLGAPSTNVEESVAEVEDVAAEAPQEVIAPDNPPQALTDEITVVAGGVIDVTEQLLRNDLDPDSGQVLAIIAVGSTRPDAVALVDGRVQFQPDESLLQSLSAGETTTETLSYTVGSGALSADADVVIVYQGSNDAPVANNDVAETNEDVPLVLAVISNDRDPDLSDTLVITAVDDSTALGVISITEDGQSLFYEPSQALSEGSVDDVFSYTISDGNKTATATVTVTVAGVNDPPVLVSDPTGFTLELVPEAGEISIPLDAIFADSDLGSTLTVLALDTELTRGSVRIGSVLYDPGDAFDYLKEGEIGIEQFGITVQDEFGQTGQGVFSFQIEGVNDAPVAVANTNEVPENGAIDLAAASSVLIDDADVEGDALTVSAIRTGNVAATDGAQGEIGSTLTGAYGVLTLNADGQYSYATTASAVDGLAAGATVVDVFTYTVTDGALSASAELLITVTGVNDAPVAVANTNEVPENGAIDLAAASSVLIDDADVEGDALTVSAIRTGNVAATDGAQGEIGSTLTGAYGVLTLNADGQYSYATTASAVDSLAAGATAVDVFTYTVTDGALSASAELLITVTGVNDAPVAVANTNEVPENGAIDLAAASSVLIDDADVEGDALTVSAIRTGNVAATDGAQGEIGSTLTGAYGVLTLNADGQYSYATTASAVDGLAAGATAVDVFTYTVTDGALNASAELLITVTGVTDAPVAVANTNEVPENGAIDLAAASSVLIDDADVEGDALTVSAIRTGNVAATDGAQGEIGSTLTGAYGVLTLNADGQYSYATTASAVDGLAAGATAVDVFTYTVTDGALNASAELLITVTGVNDAPVAVANTNEVPENGAIDLAAASSVLIDDADVEGDALTVSAIRTGNVAATDGAQGEIGSTLTGAYGVLTLNADGQYSYATTASAVDGLAAGATAVDVFTYTVTDGALSASAELLITVTGVNDAPVAVANTNEVPENGAIDLAAASSVLIDDADVEGDALTVSAIRTGNVAATDGAQGEIGSTLTGAYGVLTLNANGQYSYATTASAVDGLAAGATAVDVFTYTVTDGALNASAELLITVTGVNDAPVAVANTNEVPENGAIDLAAASSVLIDDADVEGDALTVSAIRTGNVAATDGAQGEIGSTLTGAYGVLTLNADGQYSYATTASAVDGLAAGATVVDVFTYTVTDGALSASAELLITVTGVNDAAVIVVDARDVSVTRNAEFDAVAGGQISISDLDLDQAEIISATAAFGVVTLGADGSWQYDLNDTNSEIVALDEGLAETVVDTITFTSVDGSQVNLDVTIFTANLPAVLTLTLDDPSALALTTGDVANETITGQITFDDNEGALLLPITAGYGDVAQVGDDWTYSLQNESIAIQGLDDGESLTDTIVFSSDDARDLNGNDVILDVSGSIEGRQTLTVTIAGVNDVPVVNLAAVETNQVEDEIVVTGDLGVLRFAVDPDNADGSITDTLTVVGVRVGGLSSSSSVINVNPDAAISTVVIGSYGTLTVRSDGSYSYSADSASQDAALEDASSIEDVFSIQVGDGTGTVEAELRFNIDNTAPVSVDDAMVYEAVTTGTSGLLVGYSDFDNLEISLTQTDLLPSGFDITTPITGIGRDLLISGSAGQLPESTVASNNVLSSVVGDYRLSATVTDGDNTALTDQFILSVRSPSILSTTDQVYEFVTGEADYAAVYLDPAENTDFYVYAWAPSESGDRLAVFGSTTIAVVSESGSDLTLERASLVDLNASLGADVITIKGSVSGLNFAGISELDTLVNQTLILASPGANVFQLQNEGVIQATSTGAGTRLAFTTASDGIVGETRGDAVIFGDTVQTVKGQIVLTPDNQPAAPYIVLASLVTDGAVEITGYSGVNISQPSELEISTTSGTALSGSLIQSALGAISISSGGRVTTETLSNSGTITLTNNNYNGVIVGGAGSAGHLVITGSYTESGTLISQVSDSFYIPASDPNELSAANMVLTGEIKANADLLFSNVNQSLDWRAGTITLAPTANLIIAGGSVTLGTESTINGFGGLVFGQALAPSESDSSIVIDGAVSTAQFGSDFTFESSRVVIAPFTNAAVDTLTIANLDQWTFDNEVVNTNLQIDGTLEVGGGNSALIGSTTIAASGSARLNETVGINTNLTVGQTLTNLGNIEINLDPLASGELAYNTPITISGGNYSAATGLITIDTSAAHELATGDVIRMNDAFPEGYNYTGEVTVISTTSFSFAAASDPGPFQSGGSIDGFSTSLTLSGGLTNSGSLVVEGTKPESADQTLYSDARVLIDGDITNSAGGSLIFREGDIILEGNLSNAGILEIDGATSAGSTSYSGANVTLDGDLILATTSNLQFEVTTSGEYYFVNGLYLEAGGVVRGGDADAFNLGGLILNFNDSSLGNNFSGQDSNTLFLFYDNAISGANFNTLTTDLAAGYEAEVQATVSSSDTSVQTISVVVSDDMEFESSANGNFGAESTVWVRQPLLADVASASWSAGVATLVTSAAHGLTDNQTVDIYGAGSSGYDYYGVISVIDNHTITYNVSVDPVSDPGDLQVTDDYASNVVIASADWSNSDLTVTVVTESAHGLEAGQTVSIYGSVPSLFDYSGVVTVVDATTFSYALLSDPGPWVMGGALQTLAPTVYDDVRIVHALTVDAGEVVSLNSFSLETSKTYGTSTTTTTVGTLSLDGDSDLTAETTSFNVADRSTVAYGSSLYVGSASSTSTDTVNLVLGEALTVHGWITLRTGATVNSGGNGKILISETGQGAIWDSVELNLDVEIEAGGGLSLAPFGPQVISGSGQIVSSGAIEAGVYNGIAIGVDIVNHGDLELRFDNTSSGAFEVVAGSETAIISDGRLIASSVRSGVLSLNDNTLDARGGELALFVNSGVSDTYGLTLVGGSAAASPGLIKLQDTVFSIPGRAVTISAVETSTAGIWTVSFTVSEPISYLVSPDISGGTLGSLSVATNNIDGSVTFTAEATKDPSGDMVITLADNAYGEYLGGEITIDSGGGTSFTSNLGATGELSLTGHLELQLTGSVDFVVGDDALALTLQGSTADSIRLSNGAAETATLMNSETIYFNNLTVDTNVILVNAVDPDWASIDPAVITLSGVSVFDGDLYNLRDPESYTAATTGVYLLDSVTFNGAVLQQAGAYLYVGVDATLIGGRATSVVFTNDFTNDGFMTVGSPAGALDHLIKVGSDAAAGTFSNSGNFTLQINASGSSSGTVELDGVLLNTGSVYALGQLTLDATSTAAQHESSGLIYLSGAYSGLTLGSDDTLTMSAGSYLVANGVLQTLFIDASATGAALVLSGTLGIGDTVTDYVAGVASIAAGVGTLEVKTSSEFTVNAGSNLTLDAGFGLASSDSLLVSGPTGTLRLNGGRLSVTSTYATATSVGLISATTILGSFDTIDGLILDTIGGRTVADVVQTATGISLTPVTNAAVVLEDVTGTGSVFDFSGSANITHYLAKGGDDLIKSVDSGDSAFGEAGDDTFVLNSVAINRIDGGTGIDQIVLPGTINFDFTKEGIDNTLGTADDWLGHRFERIELLSMEDATNQTMALDASALRSINDGANELLNDEAGLVVKGNIGDVINLSGDFDYTEDRFAQMRTAVEPGSGSAVTMSYAPELFTGISDGAVSLFFDQDVLLNVTHTNAGVSRYGHSGDDVLAGSSLGGETLAGRGGDDQLDALAGADRQLGGDGNDSIVFDSADLEMDGGNGVDTLLLSGSVDFSQLDQLANFEQVDMSGNNSADSLSLTFADVFELVGDNSLDAYVPANDHKVLVINGDSEDALVLNGVDIRNQTAVQTGIDLYGDGTTYALFQDTDLGVDVYVLSDLLSGASPSGSEKVSGPVMAGPTLDQYLYEPSADHFGGL